MTRSSGGAGGEAAKAKAASAEGERVRSPSRTMSRKGEPAGARGSGGSAISCGGGRTWNPEPIEPTHISVV